jgi:hypothetical protein
MRMRKDEEQTEFLIKFFEDHANLLKTLKENRQKFPMECQQYAERETDLTWKQIKKWKWDRENPKTPDDGFKGFIIIKAGKRYFPKPIPFKQEKKTRGRPPMPEARVVTSK